MLIFVACVYVLDGPKPSVQAGSIRSYLAFDKHEISEVRRSRYMNVDRRTFILRTALGTIAAAIAGLLPLSPTAQAYASRLPSPLPTTLPAGGTDQNCLVFKIDGWDSCDDAMDGSNTAPADSMINDPAADRVLIRINQSWRTTWR